jgi:hypothetical protein
MLPVRIFPHPQAAPGWICRRGGRPDTMKGIPMSDTPHDAAAPVTASGKATNLNAKSVKRRMAKISSGTEPRAVNKKKGKLAIAILTQIAAGQIKNPAAVAKAFVAAETDAPDAAAPETADSEA